MYDLGSILKSERSCVRHGKTAMIGLDILGQSSAALYHKYQRYLKCRREQKQIEVAQKGRLKKLYQARNAMKVCITPYRI